MKITERTDKDGKLYATYKPENKDEIVSLAKTTFKSEPRPTIVDKGTPRERAVNITRRGISATWNGKEIFVQLTEGQCKVLDKVEDLTGKTIVFENYKSKAGYGTLVGARIKK